MDGENFNAAVFVVFLDGMVDGLFVSCGDHRSFDFKVLERFHRRVHGRAHRQADLPGQFADHLLFGGVAALRAQGDAAHKNGVAFFGFEYAQPRAKLVDGFIEFFDGVSLNVQARRDDGKALGRMRSQSDGVSKTDGDR